MTPLERTASGPVRWSSRHPWATVGLWAAVAAVSGWLWIAVLPGVLTTSADFTGEPEAKRGARILEEAGLLAPRQAREIVIVRSMDGTVDTPAFTAAVKDLTGRIAALGPDIVAGTFNYYLTSDESLVSRDRRTTIIPVIMAGTEVDAGNHIDEVFALVQAADGRAGLDVIITGSATLDRNFGEVAERDLARGESIGITVALIILLLVFGTVVSALIPVGLAMIAIVTAMGASALVGQVFALSFFVTNMISMMGLATGIDYSLFIVSRFREELRHGRSKQEALEIAGATAGRAVFFSGMTVVLALTGLLLMPTTIFRSLATGAILVVVAAVIAAFTLLPALLSLLGGTVNAWPVRPGANRANTDGGGMWDWISRRVMKQPALALSLAAGALLIAAVPYLGIRTGAAGVTTLPDDLEAKQGFLILEREFAVGATTPARIAVTGDVASPAVRDAVARLTRALEQDPGIVAPVESAQAADGRVLMLTAGVRGDPVDTGAVATVRRIRQTYVPQAIAGAHAEALVTGVSAFNIDFFDLTDRYTPIVFAFVLGLTLLLLLVVFRSLVVPAKAIVMNLLSVGSAYGLVVLVTQKGFGAAIFGFTPAPVVEAWIPLFLFCVLFGLSMDYHVFLLSRIREQYDHTHDNTGSVAFGLRSTGGLITGAALIMVAVFGGFASGDLVPFQQMGFGLAVAVLVDATIVRSILVPAAMKLLGRSNWFLPKALAWLPRVGVEGKPATVAPDPAPGPRP